MSLPLQGIKVLDLSRLLPGGYATFLMASMGAEVIKVEEPGSGDYVRWMPPMHGDLSSGHIALNRGKRSITLNLKAPGAAEVLLQLAANVDVLVESFRPGVLDRLGVGWQQVSQANPKLIWLAISGYGQSGPYRDRAGHDIDYLAYAGVLDLTGVPGQPAAIPGVQLADLGGGALLGLVGVLAALHQRTMTGKGSFVDASMTDGAFGLAAMAAQSAALGYPWPRGGGPISGGLACYRVYRCQDGLEIAVGALEPKFFVRLCETIEAPELAALHLDLSAQPELMKRLEAIFATKPRSDWLQLLEPMEVCVAPVRTLTEAFEDPQIKARQMMTTVKTDAGEVQVPASPLRIGDQPGSVDPSSADSSLPPSLGADTDDLLTESGFSQAEIDDMRKQGIL